MSLQWYRNQIQNMLKQIQRESELEKVYKYVRFFYMKQ